MDTIKNLVSKYPLNRNEEYCGYRFAVDPWPWGFNGGYDNPSDVASVYAMLSAYPDTTGLWITKETMDGTSETTILKWWNEKN